MHVEPTPENYQLVYARARAQVNGESQAYIMDLSSYHEHQLSYSMSPIEEYACSTDGERFVFRLDDILHVFSEYGLERSLQIDDFPLRGLTISNDGNQIVAAISDIRSELHLFDLTSDTEVILVDDLIGVYPMLSPDGEKIAFSEVNIPPQRSYVYVMDLGSAPHYRLIGVGSFPTWVDEQTLAYSPSRLLDMWTLNSVTIPIPRIESSLIYSPAWSPDGNMIAYLENDRTAPVANLYIIGADGRNIQQLTRNGYIALARPCFLTFRPEMLIVQDEVG
jgi:Tol biopolymer transport system component